MKEKIITLYCIVDRKEIPPARAARTSVRTCSNECRKILLAHHRALRDLAICRACSKPSTPEQRKDFKQWKKTQGPAAKRGRPRKVPAPPNEPKTTHDLLLMVGYDVPLYVIEKWAPEELAAAEKWAAKSYLRASDNPVRVPARPQFLDEWKWEHDYPRPVDATVMALVPRSKKNACAEEPSGVS